MLLPGAMAENSIDLGTNMGDHLSAQARLCDIELTSEKIFDDFRDCPEVLEEVAALFRENYRFDISSLHSALTARDNARIAFLAHKMKGSILYFHQDGAVRNATVLEEKAKRNDLKEADTLFESLAQTYDIVCSSLEQAERMLVERAMAND